MIGKAFNTYFQRHLNNFIQELEAYPSEEMLWKELPGTSNSAGVLAHHLEGNLKHFIGMVLGGSDYKRDRPAEFADRGIPRADLIARLRESMSIVEEVLLGLSDEEMKTEYPEGYFGGYVEGSKILVMLQLESHIAYHLGQVNYHRRYFATQG